MGASVGAARGRLPKETRKREALDLQIGADGYQRLDRGWCDERPQSLRVLPALEGLRQIWLQHYDRACGTGDGLVRGRVLRRAPAEARRLCSAGAPSFVTPSGALLR